jgi:hypothetical protein
MSNITLTATQHAVLDHAIHHTEGQIDWFPDGVQGGAKKKVINGLFNRALIEPLGSDWFVADQGYDALGCVRPVACSMTPNIELQAVVARTEAELAQDATANDSTPTHQPMPKMVRTRADSKQAMVIAMLTRAEGVTINQICQATLWQAHTARGALAGVIKKKLGLTITSTKDAAAGRIYRITN